jgi:cytochrome b6-f complex iron-sulfur subunit
MPDEERGANPDEVGRRQFLDYLIGGSFAVTLLSIAASILRYITPPHIRSAAQSGPVEVASAAEVPPGTGKVVPYEDTSIIVINQSGKFLALSAICTHAQCVVEYNPQKKEIDCPCHGGVFDLQGNVVAGPPPKPLAQYRAEVKGEKVLVGGA